jgi:glutamyl-tRNA reductase
VPLVIANREPHLAPAETAQAGAGIPDATAPIWRTCLREVAFADEAGHDLVRAGQRFVEGDAYRLLLEILCGLRSPMVGETQVMGQFKSFLASLDVRHAWINKVGQRLLTDAGAVRTKYLQGLGSRSYGSAIRRHLADCEQAVLVGTGKLAQEVLPFLAGAAARVEQWGRSNETPATGIDSVAYHTLDQLDHVPASAQPTVLVIAAPVPTHMVNRIAAHYPTLRRVIDLRADLGDGPLDIAAPIVSLHTLFAEMEASQDSAAPQIEAARKDIVWRSRQYELRDETRPFGWEDLCA